MHSFAAVVEKSDSRQHEEVSFHLDILRGRCSSVYARYKTALLVSVRLFCYQKG